MAEFNRCQSNITVEDLVQVVKDAPAVYKKKTQIVEENPEGGKKPVVSDLLKKLKAITDKTKVYDIFQQTRVGDMRMYSQDRTLKDIISYSMELKSKENTLKGIQLLKNLCPNLMKGYCNLVYIEMMTRQIKLVKQLFVFKVELGEEAYIPALLNQKDLGQSFKYYNPILSIIQDNCSDHKKNLYFERNKLLLRLANEDAKLMDKVRNRLLSSK